MAERPLGSYRWGEALILIRHMSWKAEDQLRLARHYLARMPYADGRAYEAFASVMSLDRFLLVLDEHWPSDPSDRQLSLYCLGGAFDMFEKNAANDAAIRSFVETH